MLAASDGRRRVVTAANEAALRQGLRPGIPLAKAQVLVPGLRIEDSDPRGDLESLERLAFWALRYTPVVAADPPDGIVMDIEGAAHLMGGEKALIEDLRQRGYPVVDLTDDEMAKVHVRHMVGGRGHGKVAHEIVYRFEFPERPGALSNFLSKMGGRWNISMFHYRNHGAAYGRVLVGIQVPPEQRPRFQEFLDKLGYEYAEETANPAYRIFLS